MNLNANQQEVLNLLIKDYGEGNILCIQTLVNADFTDKEDVPSGIITVHTPESQVLANAIPNNSFDYMVVCPILKRLDGREWTDNDFKEKEKIINEAVPQFSANPITLKTRNIETNLDAKTWQAEFGENDSSFAGIFKKPNGRDTDYYVVVQAGAPLVCQQLREHLNRNPMSFEKFINTKEYMYCNNAALRNAQRLAYSVARAANVDIKYHADVASKISGEFECPPWRAKSLYTQPVSTIEKLKDGNIGVYNKVTPTSQIINTHYVYSGPYNGIIEYQMKNETVGYGLPAHTGRHDEPKPVTNAKKRSEGVICEKINAKDHPDLTHETFKSHQDENFKNAMKKYGWHSDIVTTNLIPVVIKVYDPNIKRK